MCFPRRPPLSLKPVASFLPQPLRVSNHGISFGNHVVFVVGKVSDLPNVSNCLALMASGHKGRRGVDARITRQGRTLFTQFRQV